MGRTTAGGVTTVAVGLAGSIVPATSTVFAKMVRVGNGQGDIGQGGAGAYLPNSAGVLKLCPTKSTNSALAGWPSRRVGRGRFCSPGRRETAAPCFC